MMKSNFLAFYLFALSPNNLKTKKSFVIRSGFEPETHSLEGCCSIQLSYQTSSECAYRMNDACQRRWGDRDSSS